MSTKRILAVEDNDLVRSFLEAGLSTAGYAVETAHNGREALEKIDRAPYDLIITDMRMPELDGPAFCRALAERGDDVLGRVLLLATPHSLDDHGTFVAESGLPALTKPVPLEHLHSAVESMLAAGLAGR